MKLATILITSLAGVCCATSIVVPTVLAVNNAKNVNNNDKYLRIYNDCMKDFSKTTENDDINTNKYKNDDLLMKKFYAENTRPIYIKLPSSQKDKFILESGTIWRVPENVIIESGTCHWSYNCTKDYSEEEIFFATNIHVINSLLDGTIDKIKINNQLPNLEVYSTLPEYNNEQTSEINYNQPFTNGVKENKKVKLSNLKLEKISITNQFQQYLKTRNVNYSDFAVLSATAIMKGKQYFFKKPDPSQNPDANKKPDYIYDRSTFITNENEFNKIINGITKEKKYPIYIAGFPHIEEDWLSDYVYNQRFVYSTVRYDYDKIETYTSSAYRELTKNNYYNYKNALNVVGQELHSYAHQLIMPGLNLGPGSSGSVITTIDENNNIKVLGIWWGVYNKIIGNNSYYFGGCDFLYSPQYDLLGNENLVPEYNNLQIIAQTENPVRLSNG